MASQGTKRATGTGSSRKPATGAPEGTEAGRERRAEATGAGRTPGRKAAAPAAWEDLLAEALLWRGLHNDLLMSLMRLGAEDPERQRFAAGVEYAMLRLEGIARQMDRTARLDSLARRGGGPPTLEQAWASFAEVKRRLDLAEVIEDLSGAPLARAGRQWSMRCPLPGHEDRTPSFYVNPAKQVWFCHGCHRGGDVITFAREFHDLVTAGEARRLLQRRYLDGGE